MNAEEYANLERQEDRHWYYAGKREIAHSWLRRAAPVRPEEVLLDCGAGTGRFAQEMARDCRVLVLDDHEESLRMLRTKFRPEQVLSLAGDRVPLPDASIDLVTALDVLEHTPDDRAVVDGFSRLLRPGGVALVTVPAGFALWGDWDVALHHFRRYSKAQLCALFPADQWELVHVNYTNVFVYPVVWIVRRWRRWFPSTSRSEDRLPPRWVNSVLRQLFVETALLRVPMPLGVSLLLVARRRGPAQK